MANGKRKLGSRGRYSQQQWTNYLANVTPQLEFIHCPLEGGAAAAVAIGHIMEANNYSAVVETFYTAHSWVSLIHCLPPDTVVATFHHAYIIQKNPQNSVFNRHKVTGTKNMVILCLIWELLFI